MIELGLLEAPDAQTILSYADPDDQNRDGISGRPNWVWSVAEQKVRLGRFGWKAGNPTIQQQSAGAFRGDIGSLMFFWHKRKSEKSEQMGSSTQFSNFTLYFDPINGEGHLFIGGTLVIITFSLFCYELARVVVALFGF